MTLNNYSYLIILYSFSTLTKVSKAIFFFFEKVSVGDSSSNFL